MAPGLLHSLLRAESLGLSWMLLVNHLEQMTTEEPLRVWLFEAQQVLDAEGA